MGRYFERLVGFMSLPLCISNTVVAGVVPFLFLWGLGVEAHLSAYISFSLAFVVWATSLLLNRARALHNVRAGITDIQERLVHERDDVQKELQRALVRANDSEALIKMVSRASRAFIDSMNVEHDYAVFAVKYIVDPGGNDRWLRRYVIEAGAEPIRVLKGIVVGAQGERVDGVGTLTELSIKIRASTGEATFLPFMDEPNRARKWEGAILFTPRIEPGKQRILEVNGAWPGVWNDLRETGEDVGTLSISKPARELRIEVAFPESWKLDLVPITYPNIGHSEIAEAEDTGAKQRKVIWHMNNATTGTYVYKVIRNKIAPIDD